MSDPKKTETSAPALDAWTKWVAHGSHRALDPLGLDEEKVILNRGPLRWGNRRRIPLLRLVALRKNQPAPRFTGCHQGQQVTRPD